MAERIRRLLAAAIILLTGTVSMAGAQGVAGSGETRAEKRYECEKAEVYANLENALAGKRKIGNVRVSDKNASGGAVAGSTGGKFFLFKNTPEANVIRIAYASPNTNVIQALIRYPGADEFTALSTIDFSTSNSWNMNSSYIAVSPVAYIPEGSDVLLRPQVDVNLDYLYFTLENTRAAAEIPAGTINADAFSSGSEEDIMAPYGRAATLSAGDSFSLTVPAGGPYNVISIEYSSSDGAVLNIAASSPGGGNGGKGTDAEDGGQGGASDGGTAANPSRFALGKTPLRSYVGTGMRLGSFDSGDRLTFTCESGELRIACVAHASAPESSSVSVGKLPDGSERLTVDLDGVWNADATGYLTWEPPETVPELYFPNSVPVPGLWGNAAYSPGRCNNMMMWLKRVIVLDEEPSCRALLRIGSAMYGRYIYVNGIFAGSCEYNYSSSVTDVTGMLRKGENTIVIMLGSFSSQSGSSSSPAHVLYDGESTKDEPGITDSVQLIFNAGPDTEAVQVAPDIDGASVGVKVRIRNRRDADVVTDVKLTVYELGLFKDGKALNQEVKVAEYTDSAVNIAAGKTAELLIESIKINGFSREKCWTPENPYLYRLEIETSGDTYSIRFGMRTFSFEPGTGMALLNGERRFLFGTNVAIERYFDDPLCGTTPWDEAWIRKLYKEFRSINWTCFRTHLGHAGSKWFDIADETGMMIFDEYPIWGNAGDDTEKTIIPEILTWIDDRGYHPSLIVFDAQNEATYPLTDTIIKRGREYDIQKRPWDNGWRPPEGELDPIECHPYIIGSEGISGIDRMTVSEPIVTTADIGWKASGYKGHAFILNEHGEYWINREGKAMSATAGTWNAALPGVSNEKRLEYYCELMSAQLEAFRTGRAYTGLLFFCGLGSSGTSALGFTSDVLEPDVSSARTLSIHPYFKYLMENTNSPLGIVINTYAEKRAAGDSVSVPVVLVNDTGSAVNALPVTLVIRGSDGSVLLAERRTVDIPAFSADNNGTSTEIFDVNIPEFGKYCAGGSELTVQAYYVKDGKTVFSQRKWRLTGGGSGGGALPEYDWLDRNELPKEYKAEDYIDVDPVSDNDNDNGSGGDPGESGNSGGNAFTKALPWMIAGACVLLAGAAVAIAAALRKKK